MGGGGGGTGVSLSLSLSLSLSQDKTNLHGWLSLSLSLSRQDQSAWVEVFRFLRQNVSFKMLTKADFNSFSDLFSVHLWAVGHINLKFVITL